MTYMKNTQTTAHLADRFVVTTETGQHYGNFPTLRYAEKQARKLTASGLINYLEVTLNGTTVAIITKGA